ncbi:MAG: universal stress protein [Candidatus Rokubacteria bacterium]|nr:universal stress protein [Candidatus Rokubacteria bacterium]
MKRILVPLDRTAHAESVVPVVADLARGGGAVVRLLTVTRMPENVLGSEGQVIAYTDQEAARLEADGMDYLHGIEARLDPVPVECAVRFGDPVDEIVREAESFGAELIALTGECHRGVLGVALGRTASRVCLHTPTAVMVFREAERS